MSRRDQDAKQIALKRIEDFWEDFDGMLSPSKCSKMTYKEVLEELLGEVDSRLDVINDELQAEGEIA